MPSVCPACAPRVSGVGPTRSAHGWRPSGVYIHASNSAHSCVHAQKSRRTQRTTTNAQRWSSALDARVAHGDAHPANDDALAKIATFSARRPCVVPVFKRHIFYDAFIEGCYVTRDVTSMEDGGQRFSKKYHQRALSKVGRANHNTSCFVFNAMTMTPIMC